MTAATAHRSPARRPPGLFAYVSFAIMLGGWIAFLAALLASRATLDDIWTTVRDLPLVMEGVVWLVGFPFLAGLAIWQSSWDEAMRLAAVALLAGAYTFMFIPRERRR